MVDDVLDMIVVELFEVVKLDEMLEDFPVVLGEAVVVFEPVEVGEVTEVLLVGLGVLAVEAVTLVLDEYG